MKACEDYDVNFINMSQAVKYSLFDDIDFLSHYSKKFRFMKTPLIDGLITWASSLAAYLSEEQIISQFAALAPLPMIDIGYIDLPNITALRIDNACSMRLIIKHLVSVHGYKKIAFFGSEISNPHRERLESFKKMLAEFNLNADEAPVFMTRTLEESDIIHTIEEIYETCFKDGTQSHKIDAIVTSSDIIASTLISRLQHYGISVPEDVAVTGFNNQYQGITSPTPITTIDLEYFKRGYMAVELLINRIMNPENAHKIVKIPTSLIVRESCGCLEREILAAGAKPQKSARISDLSSEEEYRNYLYTQINGIFPKETHERKIDLINAIFEDLYDEDKQPPRTVQWFRLFANNERTTHFDARRCQQKITELRHCLLELAGSDAQQKNHMEAIASQLRVLCSVISDYESIAHRDSSYIFNNITQAAIHFVSATNGKEMQTALKTHLSEIGIPGIILALSDNMTTDLCPTTVELVVPERDETASLPVRVTEEALFPKTLFPKTERYSVVLEILHYNDRYFGYAFMHMKTRNMVLYDNIRLLLCHSLYTLYLKEGRTKEHSMHFSAQQLEGVLSFPGSQADTLPASGKLTLKKITSYLIEHIGDKTQLDTMSRDLGMNKTKLIRQTKAVSGYTVQVLHEKLKMELAKSLLLEEKLTLAEIAERLGFQNGNYFSNVFKKNVGESPRSWAKWQKGK